MNEYFFMKQAIGDAIKRRHHFGAVVVKNKKIIGKGSHRPAGDPRFHAETTAILKATKKLKTRNLKNCILYSTCEPCPMCFYMAWITNISKIIFGANVQDAIKAGSREIKVSAKFLNKKGDNKIKIKSDFMRKECKDLLNKKF